MDGIATQAGMVGRRAAAGAADFGLSSRVLITGSLSRTGGIIPNLISFSLCCWIKINTQGRYDTIIDTRTMSGNGILFGYRDGDNTERLSFYTKNLSYAYERFNDTALARNVWHHVAVTFDRTTRDVTFYLNGAQDGTANNSLLTGGLGNLSYQIGNKNMSSVWSFFNGSLADFRIYEKILTASDLSNLISGIDVTNSLVCRYFGNDDDVSDLSGNGNNLSNSGSTFSTDGPLD